MTDDVQVDPEWVQKQLENLGRDAEEIWEVNPDEVSEFRPWAVLKLITLSAVVDIYTKIIPKTFDNMFYIDLMAGTGSVVINSEDAEVSEKLVGSPILATAMANNAFEHMYLIEMDEDRADALRDRLTYVAEHLDYDLDPDGFTVVSEDANDFIDSLVDDLRGIAAKTKSAHSLVFVDNEGLNVSWETMEKLSEVFTDYHVNFPGNSVQRQIGKENEEVLNRFFGDQSWKVAETDPDDLQLIYKSKLAGVDRPAQHEIRITGMKSYYYDMIYAAQETEKNNPYIAAFDSIAKQVEPLNGDDIDLVMKYMRGEPTDFTPFPGRHPDQSGLGSWT